jgi:hypothetical protein
LAGQLQAFAGVLVGERPVACPDLQLGQQQQRIAAGVDVAVLQRAGGLCLQEVAGLVELVAIQQLHAKLECGALLDGHLAGRRLQRQRTRHQLMLHAMAAKHADGAQLGKRLNKLCDVIGRLSQRHRGLGVLLPGGVVAGDASGASIAAFDLGSQGQIVGCLGRGLGEQLIPAVIGDQVSQRDQGLGASRSGGQVGDQRLKQGAGPRAVTGSGVIVAGREPTAAVSRRPAD